MGLAKTIVCAWRTANAGGRLVMIDAPRCQADRANPELLARCYKAGCKGVEEPAEAARPEAATPVRAEVSKPEAPEPQPQQEPAPPPRARRQAKPPHRLKEPKSDAEPCPCGCGRPVKRGNTYASRGCQARWRARRPVAPPQAPEPETPACKNCGATDRKLNPNGRCGDCSTALLNAARLRKLRQQAEPLAALLEGYPELLEQIREMAEQEMRTPEAQAIYLLREYLAAHREAVRLSADEVARQAALEARA